MEYNVGNCMILELRILNYLYDFKRACQNIEMMSAIKLFFKLIEHFNEISFEEKLSGKEKH